MEIQEEIRGVCERILGEPRRDYAGSGGWFEYDCPCCAEDNFGVPDGKYNMAVNYEIGEDNGMFMHCWKCGFAGPLSKLVKSYGTPEMYRKYRRIVDDFKESHLYDIKNGSVVINDDFSEKDRIKLPDSVSSVFDGTPDGNRALEYLHGRGVTDYLVRKHNILYVGNLYGNPYRNMVIIPSYDAFGELNYFSGRDFTGKDKYNKKNPDISKTEIVFNEGLVNWYEPVTLVEGPFDHIVTPNSIPLLGKVLTDQYAVYRTVVAKAKHTVNIMMDSDALFNAQKNYSVLNSSCLRGRVRMIRCPEGLDPSDVFRNYGKRGMLNLVSSASPLDDYTVSVMADKEIRKRKNGRNG